MTNIKHKCRTCKHCDVKNLICKPNSKDCRSEYLLVEEDLDTAEPCDFYKNVYMEERKEKQMDIYIDNGKKVRMYTVKAKVAKAVTTLLETDDELDWSETHEGYGVVLANKTDEIAFKAKQKPGKWIAGQTISDGYICSKCNTHFHMLFPESYHFCPNCGDVKMEESEE